MKILILSKKFPYPLREGEPIAITYLSRSLVKKGCQVSILVMNTTKHFFDPKDLPKNYNHFENIYSVTVDNRITLGGALQSFFSGKSYILDRFKSKDYNEKLKEVLRKENYDVVQIETPYLGHYISTIQQFSTAKIAMRAHNVEHKIWERVAQMTKNPIKKWYLKNQNRQLRKFEIELLNDYDIMLAITEKDLTAFRKLGMKTKGLSAPVGIDLSEYQPNRTQTGSISLAFIGALDWMPNQDGLIWFLEKVWPKLLGKYPHLSFHVAGKNTPDWLRKQSVQGVTFHGEVPDAKAFISTHPIFVAPLFSGSGIKIKILEAMALERAVVTTGIGAEGISAKDDDEIFIGNSAKTFFEKIAFCIENQLSMKESGLAARQFIQREFDNLEIAERVISVYQKSTSNT